MQTEAMRWQTLSSVREGFKFLDDDSFSTEKHCCKSCGEGEKFGDPGSSNDLLTGSLRMVNHSGSHSDYGAERRTPGVQLGSIDLVSSSHEGARFESFSGQQLFSPFLQENTFELPHRLGSDRGLGRRIRKIIENPELPDGTRGPTDPPIGPPLIPSFAQASTEYKKQALKILNLYLRMLWFFCFEISGRQKQLADRRMCDCIKLKHRPRTFEEFKRWLTSIGGKSPTCRKTKRQIEIAARELANAEEGRVAPPLPPLPPLPPVIPPKKALPPDVGQKSIGLSPEIPPEFILPREWDAIFRKLQIRGWGHVFPIDPPFFPMCAKYKGWRYMVCVYNFLMEQIELAGKLIRGGRGLTPAEEIRMRTEISEGPSRDWTHQPRRGGKLPWRPGQPVPGGHGNSEPRPPRWRPPTQRSPWALPPGWRRGRAR